MAHCLRVEELAVKLASLNQIDIKNISIAALLHDYGKLIDSRQLISEAKKMKIVISEADRLAPHLLHAPVGAEMARRDFGVPDEVADAIKAHTYGRPGMSKFDKIIYLADGLEPERKDIILENIRNTAFKDIDQAFKELLSYTLNKLIHKDMIIHPASIEVWNSIV